MKTRAVSFLLALAMILTMVPAQNLHAAEPAGEQPAISTQNEEPTEEKEASFGWDLTLTSLPEGSCRARSAKSALRTTRMRRSLWPGTAQEPGTTAL